jgi:uncharacterized protein (TIGR02996 family)
VTTEDDFQAALDADPADWQTRLVFADWLDERNDPRAAGFRELGRLRLNPVLCVQSSGGARHYILGSKEAVSSSVDKKYHPCMLSPDWFARCGRGDAFHDSGSWRFYDTRRAADDAAALGYAEMSARAGPG